LHKSVKDGARDFGIHSDEDSEVDAATGELCEKSPRRCSIEGDCLADLDVFVVSE
jgi:hypothetical protein